MRQRQEQSQQAKQDRLKRLWEGFSVNDVVILGPKVTKQSYGLDLCDDAGEAILMDGVLVSIEGDFARVRVGRVIDATTCSPFNISWMPWQRWHRRHPALTGITPKQPGGFRIAPSSLQHCSEHRQAVGLTQVHFSGAGQLYAGIKKITSC